MLVLLYYQYCQHLYFISYRIIPPSPGDVPFFNTWGIFDFCSCDLESVISLFKHTWMFKFISILLSVLLEGFLKKCPTSTYHNHIMFRYSLTCFSSHTLSQTVEAFLNPFCLFMLAHAVCNLSFLQSHFKCTFSHFCMYSLTFSF